MTLAINKSFDASKLTQSFMKDVLGNVTQLIEVTRKKEETLWELVASLCVHAPWPDDIVVKHTLYAVVVQFDCYELVYAKGARDAVKRMSAHGRTPSDPSPIGFILTEGADRFVALQGKHFLGQYSAHNRALIEIVHAYERR